MCAERVSSNSSLEQNENHYNKVFGCQNPLASRSNLFPERRSRGNNSPQRLCRLPIDGSQAAASGSINRIFNKLSSITNKWRSRLTVHQR
jgi:hypothetical protein